MLFELAAMTVCQDNILIANCFNILGFILVFILGLLSLAWGVKKLA